MTATRRSLRGRAPAPAKRGDELRCHTQEGDPRCTGSGSLVSSPRPLRQELADDQVGAVAPDVRGGDRSAGAGSSHELTVEQLARNFLERRRDPQEGSVAAPQRAAWATALRL